MARAVQAINALEPQMIVLPDKQLKAKMAEFQQHYARGKTFDRLLPGAFTMVREAGRRVMGTYHFDVQPIGGMALRDGRVAETRTGEGKTLVGILPIYLNALSSKGVHAIVVNDYLACHDANWMRPLYELLSLSVGVVTPFQPPENKHTAYVTDITYGTNNEFGFDYLRDNMAFSLGDKLQHELSFAVAGEVDSIPIDGARTPLIIFGRAEDSFELYTKINELTPRLEHRAEEIEGKPTKEGHYSIDEKTRQVEFNEWDHQFIEDLLSQNGLLGEGESPYLVHNLSLLTHACVALRAYTLFHRNVEYIVQGDQIPLIDEHTGRTVSGRCLSEGLHQAIETKEGLSIQTESQILASTTFQNYFRLYNKLIGMTGTADTKASEFHQIYGLDVAMTPTHWPTARKDFSDLVYLTREEKYAVIITDIKRCQALGRPILVDTASVESFEYVFKLLQEAGIEYKVPNAKYREKETGIIAQVGAPGSVTIATNMTGRGTDILLGGNWEVEVAALEDPAEEQIVQIKAEWRERHQQVIEASGLHVIAPEHHESCRIDSQLRSHTGRQGDPGSSRFYLSLEDNLMRIFASDRVKNFVKALGMRSGETIEHRMVTNAIEKAQRKIEGRNFNIRRQPLEFDDIANEQRKVIYHIHNILLLAEDVDETIKEFRGETLSATINQHIPLWSLPEQWDTEGLEVVLYSDFAIYLPIQQWLDGDDKLYEETLRNKILEQIVTVCYEKEELVGTEALRALEKQMLPWVLNDLRKDHLSTMGHLWHGTHLRGCVQRNSEQEYKREFFTLFQELLDSIKRDTIHVLPYVQARREDPAEEEARLRRETEELAKRIQFQHAKAPSMEQAVAGEEEALPEGPAPVVPLESVRNEQEIGRNKPCPCGSGRRYKHCRGQLD